MFKWACGERDRESPFPLCDRPPGEMRHIHVYILQIGGPRQTKAQVGETMSFIGVTHKSRDDSKTVHPSMDDSSQSLGAWSTLHSLQAAHQF